MGRRKKEEDYVIPLSKEECKELKHELNRLLECDKKCRDYTREEDMVIHRAIHSGDEDLKSLAITTVIAGETKDVGTSSCKLQCLLNFGNSRTQNMLEASGDISTNIEDMTQDMCMKIMEQTKNWKPTVNGKPGLSLHNFLQRLVDNVTEETRASITGKPTTCYRMERQIREGEEIARQNGLDHPSTEDIRLLYCFMHGLNRNASNMPIGTIEKIRGSSFSVQSLDNENLKNEEVNFQKIEYLSEYGDDTFDPDMWEEYADKIYEAVQGMQPLHQKIFLAYTMTVFDQQNEKMEQIAQGKKVKDKKIPATRIYNKFCSEHPDEEIDIRTVQEILKQNMMVFRAKLKSVLGGNEPVEQQLQLTGPVFSNVLEADKATDDGLDEMFMDGSLFDED